MPAALKTLAFPYFPIKSEKIQPKTKFVLLLDNPENSEVIAQIGARVISVVNEPMHFDDAEAHVGTSIGIAVLKDSACYPEALLKRADEAMYAAKAAGKNVYRFAD